jgi:hypothetical protein
MERVINFSRYLFSYMSINWLEIVAYSVSGIIVGLILYHVFGIGKKDKIRVNRGGPGGKASSLGKNSVAIGGKGGRGGVGGHGGDGGSAIAVDDNSFAMGGEGGEAGGENGGGKGGRGPLHVLMEDYPEMFKEISEQFGITEDMAKKIGKGGDGGKSLNKKILQ